MLHLVYPQRTKAKTPNKITLVNAWNEGTKPNHPLPSVQANWESEQKDWDLRGAMGITNPYKPSLWLLVVIHAKPGYPKIPQQGSKGLNRNLVENPMGCFRFRPRIPPLEAFQDFPPIEVEKSSLQKICHAYAQSDIDVL